MYFLGESKQCVFFPFFCCFCILSSFMECMFMLHLNYLDKGVKCIYYVMAMQNTVVLLSCSTYLLKVTACQVYYVHKILEAFLSFGFRGDILVLAPAYMICLISSIIQTVLALPTPSVQFMNNRPGGQGQIIILQSAPGTGAQQPSK